MNKIQNNTESVFDQMQHNSQNAGNGCTIVMWLSKVIICIFKPDLPSQPSSLDQASDRDAQLGPHTWIPLGNWLYENPL